MSRYRARLVRIKLYKYSRNIMYVHTSRSYEKRHGVEEMEIKQWTRTEGGDWTRRFFIFKIFFLSLERKRGEYVWPLNRLIISWPVLTQWNVMIHVDQQIDTLPIDVNQQVSFVSACIVGLIQGDGAWSIQAREGVDEHKDDHQGACWLCCQGHDVDEWCIEQYL